MCLTFKEAGHEVFEYDIDSKKEDLVKWMSESDFVIHLAGINRPVDPKEYSGNTTFTDYLLSINKRNLPIVFASSIQAENESEYGKSKKLAEEHLLEAKCPTYVYRFANVFGKWCRPNYNSACATFCYNIAHNLPIEIRDDKYVVHYNYVDDICEEIKNLVEGKISRNCKDILYINPTYDCSLGKLAFLIANFKMCIETNIHLPKIRDEFEFKLFKTFCDYMSDDNSTFNKVTDSRGSFEEIFKSKNYGQISVNISLPGVLKGGHYHTYKKEMFSTIKGTCEIRQRDMKTNQVYVNRVSGDLYRPVNINVGFAHDIINLGLEKSITLMWISEIYDEKTADTFKAEVIVND